jgi:hypothetical protein
MCGRPPRELARVAEAPSEAEWEAEGSAECVNLVSWREESIGHHR